MDRRLPCFPSLHFLCTTPCASEFTRTNCSDLGQNSNRYTKEGEVPFDGAVLPDQSGNARLRVLPQPGTEEEGVLC